MSEPTGAVESEIGLGRLLSPSIVAIDGPAASGKSTVGRCLADALDYLFFDTGMMYRAVTWAALEQGLDVNDGQKMGALAESLPLDIVPVSRGEMTGADSAILMNARNVTPFIRTSAVDQAVSAVSAHARVRAALSRHQRQVAQQYGAGHREKVGIVMVGRDIGTVVIPDAPIKIYLDASAKERARRRYEESRGTESAITYESVLEDIVRRDEYDSNRDVAPLSVAEGADLVDTTELTTTQVVKKIVDLISNSTQIT